MSEVLVVSLRVVVVLAFLVVMTLLAIPAVGQKYDEWLRADEGHLLIRPSHSVEPKVPESTAHSESIEDLEPALAPESPAEFKPETVVPRAGERFEAIPLRLRELGADYLKLEAVDAAGTSYRFECRMPLTENSTYSRPFAAIAPDPIEAMERVLAGVEAWQVARRPAPDAHTTGRLR